MWKTHYLLPQIWPRRGLTTKNPAPELLGSKIDQNPSKIDRILTCFRNLPKVAEQLQKIAKSRSPQPVVV